jgi:hypothetical protein
VAIELVIMLVLLAVALSLLGYQRAAQVKQE